MSAVNSDQVVPAVVGEQKLVQFIRRRRRGSNALVGVLLAKRVSDTAFISWSKCKVSVEPFNKAMGLALAEKRIALPNRHRKIPDSIRDDMSQFIARATRFFKGAAIKVV